MLIVSQFTALVLGFSYVPPPCATTRGYHSSNSSTASTVQYSSCGTVQHGSCGAVQRGSYYIRLYSTAQLYVPVQHTVVAVTVKAVTLQHNGNYSTARQLGRSSMVQYGTAWHGTVRYGAVRYGTIRYVTVRYGSQYPPHDTHSQACII